MDYIKKADRNAMTKQRPIMPSLEVCSTNCVNWDKYQKCKIFLGDKPCTIWEPLDLGDPVAYDGEETFAHQPLGDEPMEEVDVESEEAGEMEVDENG